MTRIYFLMGITIALLTITSCLQKPRAMDVFQPAPKSKDAKLPTNEHCTLTLCLGSNNRILYYLGEIKKPISGPIITGYGKDSLFKVITENMLRFRNDTSGFIVLIKASDKATYKNFEKTLRILDSCKVKSYGVVEINPQEIEWLKKLTAY